MKKDRGYEVLRFQGDLGSPTSALKNNHVLIDVTASAASQSTPSPVSRTTATTTFSFVIVVGGGLRLGDGSSNGSDDEVRWLQLVVLQLPLAEKVLGSIDLFRHILGRLPTKILLRLKCVSKYWLSLISDKEFRHMHTLHGYHDQHHRPPPSLIISSYNYENILLPLTTGAMTLPAHSLDLSFLNHGPVRVVRSCNGLLLCGDEHDHHFVCNPITKEFISLPQYLHVIPWCVYLAFEPSRSPNFQVVSTKNVWIVPNKLKPDSPIPNPPFFCRCVVYSSETGSWSELIEIPITKPISPSAGVYCNGGIHWCGGCPEFHMFLHFETLRLKLIENTFPNY
ncbi:hypothetical protein PIB30_066831 [Stylosanthes scabra]|uniref:F-box domain-containing protein n=1 Tax=Stylosanthes scabra TaxID=79078 RepID=A0ABU6WQQ6_9FABA|nr:hypothetical protein [Stylosanthes scabra]